MARVAIGVVVLGLVIGGWLGRPRQSPADAGVSVAPVSPSTTTAPTVVAATPQPVTTTVTMREGGMIRSYVLVRPSKSNGAMLPVLVVLHGRDASPQAEEQRTGFVPVVGQAILVYPAGYDESWNAGTCCGGAQTAGVDDVGFITAVVHQVLTSQSDADASRVYLAGYSNGGKMALRMACTSSKLFAGIAAYGAVSALPCATPGATTPQAVSVLEVASTGDPELSISPSQQPIVQNGFTEPSVEELTSWFRAADGCPAGPAKRVQGMVTTTLWAACTSGDRVQLSLYQGGDHGWPVGGGLTPSAEELMWGFFGSLRAA